MSTLGIDWTAVGSIAHCNVDDWFEVIWETVPRWYALSWRPIVCLVFLSSAVTYVALPYGRLLTLCCQNTRPGLGWSFMDPTRSINCTRVNVKMFNYFLLTHTCLHFTECLISHTRISIFLFQVHLSSTTELLYKDETGFYLFIAFKFEQLLKNPMQYYLHRVYT